MFILFFVMSGIVSCGRHDATPTKILATENLLVEITPSLHNSPMPTLVAQTIQSSSSTKKPLLTATPISWSITQTSENLPQSHSTATLMPTPHDPASSEVEKLWQTALESPICSLPCWWNVVPGETQWFEAQTELDDIAIQPDTYTTSRGVILHDDTFHFFDLNIYNTIELVEKEGTIESIAIRTEGLRNPNGFRTLWAQYFPEATLQKYGVPSKVVLQTFQNTVQPADLLTKFYELKLFYDPLGFVILYKGKIENIPEYLVCPTFSGNLIEEIDINLQSPASELPLESLLAEQGGQPESAYSLLDAANLTVQQFHDLLLQPNSSLCFKTESEIWPK